MSGWGGPWAVIWEYVTTKPGTQQLTGKAAIVGQAYGGFRRE